MNLPKFIRVLIEQGDIDSALDFAESDDERIVISSEDPEHDTSEVAREILFTSDVDDIEVNQTTATVYVDSFVGYHTIRTDHRGSPTASTQGSYIHEPTGFEFGGECPDEIELQDAVRKVANTEAPEVAANAAYRRSRL